MKPLEIRLGLWAVRWLYLRAQIGYWLGELGRRRPLPAARR